MRSQGKKIVLAACDSESSEYLRSGWRQVLLATLPARYARCRVPERVPVPPERMRPSLPQIQVPVAALEGSVPVPVEMSGVWE